MNDEELYLKATNEVEGDSKDPALWAKAMVLAGGDQDKAKYEYIKLRVEQFEKSKPDVQKEYGIHDRTIDSNSPKGVGGYLLIFCIVLTMLVPLFFLAKALYDWGQCETVFLHFPWYKGLTIFMLISSGAIVCYGFIAGCMIWGGNANGREIAKNYLLVYLFGFIAIKLLGIAVIYGKNVPSENLTFVIQDALKQQFCQVIIFVIWWLYFKKSKRVQNTYG